MNILGFNVYWQDFAPLILFKIFRSLKMRNQDGKWIAQIDSHHIDSYSQYNEDLMVDAILGLKESGFYVDIGANDPVIANNTERFYKKGWKGINIEPNPLLFKKVCACRPDDINLNIGIGEKNGESDFYSLLPDTLSTFEKKTILKNQLLNRAKLVEVKKILVRPIKDVFSEYLEGNYIDFMSVDVEGNDLHVLRSNDWSRYRPKLIMVEIKDDESNIVKYLRDKGYDYIFSNGTNGIFTRK